MSIRETIEKRAREAESAWKRDWHRWDSGVDECEEPVLADHIADAIIAILTDPQVGFKEALECVLDKQVSKGYNNVEEMLAGEDNEEYRECLNCLSDHRDFDTGEFIEGSPCACPCHTAEAKLAELKAMEKGI